jgi:tetratricopeptide (TPR) repeat protein
MEESKAIYELYRAGKVQQALLLAEEWFHAAGTVEALVEYVQLLLSQRFYERAEMVLKDYPQSAAESQQIYHLYHDLYVQAGRVSDLQGLQSLFNELQFPDSLDGVNTTLGHSGLRPDSIYFADQLCALCRSHTETIPELGEVGTTIEKLVQDGDTSGAVEALREVSDSIEDEASRYLLRAEISLVRGQYRTAEKRFRRLRDRFAAGALVLNRLGDICLATGRPKEAAAYYTQACENDPGDLDSARDLVRTRLIEGNVRAAKRAFIEASGRFGSEAVEEFRDAITNCDTPKATRSVNGLSWFEGGGGVLPIEVVAKAGSGHLHTTGQIGFSMQDSVLIAHDLARELATTDHISAEALDIHIHVPESVIYKDGPSAGLAFTAGVYGALIGNNPGASVGFTGEVSPTGRVTRVGGIAEKMGAAYFSGLTDVYLPAGNLPDLASVPPQVKQHLNFHLVNTVRQVKEMVWSR